MTKAMTPEFAEIIADYTETKESLSGGLLLMKCGDFHEAFYDDARAIAAILGHRITELDGVPNISIPYPRVWIEVEKLVRANESVHLCEHKSISILTVENVTERNE